MRQNKPVFWIGWGILGIVILPRIFGYTVPYTLAYVGIVTSVLLMAVPTIQSIAGLFRSK
jgi:hypothetical protein